MSPLAIEGKEFRIEIENEIYGPYSSYILEPGASEELKMTVIYPDGKRVDCSCSKNEASVGTTIVDLTKLKQPGSRKKGFASRIFRIDKIAYIATPEGTEFP